jgi:hypothetical protein
MPQWEYRTIIMGTPDKQGRRWVTVSPDPRVLGEQVGEVEKPRFAGRIHQGVRLLETAIKEMDADGWEFVSHTFLRADIRGSMAPPCSADP